jgi:hypothetical protein
VELEYSGPLMRIFSTNNKENIMLRGIVAIFIILISSSFFNYCKKSISPSSNGIFLINVFQPDNSILKDSVLVK